MTSLSASVHHKEELKDAERDTRQSEKREKTRVLSRPFKGQQSKVNATEKRGNQWSHHEPTARLPVVLVTPLGQRPQSFKPTHSRLKTVYSRVLDTKRMPDHWLISQSKKSLPRRHPHRHTYPTPNMSS